MSERVNQKTLAAYFGTSTRTLSTWQKRKHDPMPVAHAGGRGGHNEYDVKHCIQWWVRQEVNKLTGGEDGEVIDFSVERARLTKEQADKVSLQNEVLRGDLLPADEVIRRWSHHIVAVKSQLRAIPSKLKTRLPAMEQKEHEVIVLLLTRAMNELAADDFPELSDSEASLG